MADFDLEGARKAGASDQQIVDFLASKYGFDADAARAAGHDDAKILALLTREGSRRAQKQTDASWRPVAQAVGGALGAVGGAAASAAASPVTGGSSLVAGPALTYGGMALGDAMGGQAYDQAMYWFRRLTGQDPDPLDAGDQALKGVRDIGLAGSLGPVGDKAFQSVMATGRAMASPMETAISRRMGANMPTTSRQVFDDMRAAGMVPTADMVIDNPDVRRLGQSLRGAPGSAPVMNHVDRLNLQALSDYAGDIASSLGEVRTPAATGAALQSAAGRTKAGIKEQINQVAKEVEGLIPEGTPVRLDNTFEFFNQFATTKGHDWSDAASSAVNKERDAFFKQFTDPATGAIDPVEAIEIVKKIRSSVGARIEAANRGHGSDIPLSQLKQYYGALSEDIMNTARQAGPDAAKMVDEFNSLYKSWKGNPSKGVMGNEDALDLLISQQDPGKAYSTATRDIYNKTSGGGYLSRLFGMLPEVESGSLRATVFDQMGKALPGAQNATGDRWSASTALSNWNKMSPEVKQILFREVADPAERLARISEFGRELEKLANTSGTTPMGEMMKQTDIGHQVKETLKVLGAGGGPGIFTQMMSGNGLLALGAAGAGVAAQQVATPLYRRALARAMTNPDLVEKLISGRIPANTTLTPGLAGYLARQAGAEAAN